MHRYPWFIVLMLTIFLLPAGLAAAQRPIDVAFEIADADKNGLISEAEWHTEMQKRFEAADSNHDGNLSKEEVQASQAKLRERFKNRLKSD